MCSNVLVQHCPRPLAAASAGPCVFKLTQNDPVIPKDQKLYNLHYDVEAGDVLRPPHGTTPAAVKIK